ncbi:MAG: Gar1/Naf1 family protein [Candidatus Bathyarchaeota archaeon]|nr:Gar1/Naf1 family protein [Candidatus Bathyarchaeota archaeon]
MPYKEEQRKPHSIGSVMHVSKSTGQMILRAKEEASIGDFVFDSKRKRVGVVFDFFGPVDAPYIAVKPHGDPAGLVGAELYVEERRREKRR